MHSARAAILHLHRAGCFELECGVAGRFDRGAEIEQIAAVARMHEQDGQRIGTLRREIVMIVGGEVSPESIWISPRFMP